MMDSTPHRVAFCAGCFAKRTVKLIRGFNGARDRLECEKCGRRWEIGRRVGSNIGPPA